MKLWQDTAKGAYPGVATRKGAYEIPGWAVAMAKRGAKTAVVPWFLWSIVYPGGAFYENEIHAQPVHEYKDKWACEDGLKEYRTEVDKAFPQPKSQSQCTAMKGGGQVCTGTGGFSMAPWVTLKCSPVNPKP